jgi:RNA 2',3'-cyclic 3'-phosphodiesterase
MLRLFTALAVPFDIAETLARRQTGLPGARWRPTDHLHITLSFYGEMDERRADDLASELERVRGEPLTLSLNGVGSFGEGHRARTLWAGVGLTPALEVLAGRCKAAGERAGIAMERRTYRPHVTLAYLKTQTDPDRIGAWMAGHNMLKSPDFRIDRFALYSSVTTPDGGIYTLEREYPL